MRKVVASLGISLDGFIARSDGAVDFLFMPEDFSMAEFFSTVDTAVMGRKTFDESHKYGGLFGGMKSYVFSRSQSPGERGGATFVTQEPATFVANLRETPGKDIWLIGGGQLVRDFLQADLVDDLHLGIVPVLLGEGLPLFPPPFPQRQFELIDNESYGRGMVFLRYRRAR